MKHFFSNVLLITLLACTVHAQAKPSDCQKQSDFLNDDIDRFAASWVGSVKSIQIIEKKFEDTEPSIETKITLKFGDNGTLAESFLSNARIPVFGRTVYKYDSLGKIIKRTTYNPDGSAVMDDIYTYEPDGRLTSKYTQNAKSKILIGPKKH
ncbi:MAG: hypothetical protein M3449_01000 [Acidobacteriota bacterium]|nr:hypothetical protein [Acidobacteriota bacterium]